MKRILLHPDALRVFVREAEKNSATDGGLVQSMVYLLGYETDGVIKTTELLFPFQERTLNSVTELGEYINLTYKCFIISYTF